MQNFSSGVSLMIGACGIYFLYLWIKIRILGKIPADFALISKEYPIEQVSDAYKYIEQNRDTVQKVILNV